jgi:hypothetical protein
MKTTTSPTTDSMNRSSRHCGTIAGLIQLIIGVAPFALAQFTHAQCPQICDGNANTAIGSGALVSNTTGSFNAATGVDALQHNTTGGSNTANGANALVSNTTGNDNTAIGNRALISNTTGFQNTAIGSDALFANTTGNSNTAVGLETLLDNTTGFNNTASGQASLLNNTTGSNNTANGDGALYNNTIGATNTAIGANALFSNSTGGANAAVGENALNANTTGTNNIALGASAGSLLTIGNNNIDIGALGVASESNVIRVGKTGVQHNTFIAGINGAIVPGGVPVLVGANGHLGTMLASAGFNDAIQPMDEASETIFALQPVTFPYEKDLDPQGIPQYGLVAEQVEKVNPDLVARDDQGKAYTVRYEAVNAMLLNEFLKEHKKVEAQQATIAELKSTVAQQQKATEALTAQLKEQAAQIQKVSAQLELSKPEAKVVINEP